MEYQIKKQQVMKLLLQACPSYQERWKVYFEDNYGDDDEPLLYVDLGDFAHHLIDLYKTNKLEEFPEIFQVIEQLHVNGDEYVKEAATIGLLEAIQNVSSNSNLNPKLFITYLNPESLKWWNHLNDFWEGKTNFVGDKEK
ncbi:hypothetical protein QFZ81_002971 [Paenibacillus sp. V4I9]|uniref:DUF7674 family protein n=1 Tax=Paenibacillus sp. V4I9 TaxID=3042308 RepID=UPI002784ED43|nr:hypothetical protein [Paenibacillus sp. V4I9]MDQ0887883.1 hypothetical protein [Paenibacillus sp. V4I9]